MFTIASSTSSDNEDTNHRCEEEEGAEIKQYRGRRVYRNERGTDGDEVIRRRNESEVMYA